jgi:hypothetical protein
MKGVKKPSGSTSAGDAIAAESGHVSRRHGPTRDERIRIRAYKLYCERGGTVSDDTIDCGRSASISSGPPEPHVAARLGHLAQLLRSGKTSS